MPNSIALYREPLIASEDEIRVLEHLIGGRRRTQTYFRRAVGRDSRTSRAGFDTLPQADSRPGCGKRCLGFEIPGFTYAFLPEHPEFLDFAATTGISTEAIESIRSRISPAERQHRAVDALLRQFAGVGLTPQT
ncbi:MAG: hypothetical protein H0V47_03025 [Chloroflexia bacterium]|nr:hypothetical protein [Chloroflexia bacterium]